MATVSELKERRKEQGISAVDLALVIGMHGAGLSRIESGNIDPRISTLNRIEAGLDTIEQNRIAIANGVIVLDKLNLKNTIFQAIISELESRVDRGKYDGDAKHLADILVTLIIEKITKT